MGVKVPAIASANSRARIVNPGVKPRSPRAIDVGSCRRQSPRLAVRDPGGVGFLGESQQWLQLEEALLPDTLHVHQVFDLLETAVLLTVFEDPLRRFGADAGERLQL